MFMNPIHTSGL